MCMYAVYSTVQPHSNVTSVQMQQFPKSLKRGHGGHFLSCVFLPGFDRWRLVNKTVTVPFYWDFNCMKSHAFNLSQFNVTYGQYCIKNWHNSSWSRKPCIRTTCKPGGKPPQKYGYQKDPLKLCKKTDIRICYITTKSRLLSFPWNSHNTITYHLIKITTRVECVVTLKFL